MLISVQPVPLGVDISRTDYWTKVFDLGSLTTGIGKNFTVRYEENYTTTATMDVMTGEWVVWDYVLYRALNDIHIGDAYIEGSNIQHITVEEVINDVITLFNGIIGALTDLNTTDKTSIVNAINEVLSTFNSMIGALTDLNTVDQSSIVNAINEVLATIGTVVGTLSDLNTVDQSNIVNAINEVLATIGTVVGDLIDLDTVDQSNIVNAINEVISTFSGVIGALTDLNTVDQSSIVNAINEVLGTIGNVVGDLTDLDTTDKTSIVNAINELYDDLFAGTSQLHAHTLTLTCNHPSGITSDNTLMVNRDINTTNTAGQTGGIITRLNIGANVEHHEFGSFDIVHSLSHKGSLEHVGHYSQMTNQDTGSDALWGMVSEVKDIWQDNLYPQATSASDLCSLELDVCSHFTPENAGGKKRMALSLVALGGGTCDYGIFISAGTGTGYNKGSFREGIRLQTGSIDPDNGYGIYSASDCASALAILGTTKYYGINLASTGETGISISGNYTYPLVLKSGNKIHLNGANNVHGILFDPNMGNVTIVSGSLGFQSMVTSNTATAGSIVLPSGCQGYITVTVNGYQKHIPFYG